jgi:hypothetical protein
MSESPTIRNQSRHFDDLGVSERQPLLAAWKGNVLEQKCTLQSLGIEEAQSANDLVIAGPGQLLFLN